MGERRDIIAELLRRGRPDLANVVSHGRIVTADAKDLVDAADRLIGPFIKTVQARVDRVVELADDWAVRGDFNSRKIKIALTKLSQEVDKITKLKAPSNLRPREKDQLQQSLTGMKAAANAIKDDHKTLGKLNHHDLKATEMFIRGLKRTAKFTVEWLEESIKNVKEWASMLVPKEFKLGRFDVIDDYGIHERIAEPWFTAIIRGSQLLEKAGFGHLLYGELHLALDDNWGGMYYHKGDRVDLYLTYEKRRNPELLIDTLVHELGHRQWFRFMDAGQRDQFSAPWIDQDEMIKQVSDTISEVFSLTKADLRKGFEVAYGSDFDFGTFRKWLSRDKEKELAWIAHLMRCYDPTAQSRPFAVDYDSLNQEAFDATRSRILNWKERLREAEEGGFERERERAERYIATDRKWLENDWLDEKTLFSLSHSELMNIFEPGRIDMQAPYAKPVQRALKISPIKPSVTEYGQTNRKEDFAETFEEVLRGRERSHKVMVRLQRALPKAKILSQVTASGDRLYHTTSVRNLLSILKQQKLKPKDTDNPFVSFAERPYFGDISHNEAVLVFDRKAISDVMKVEYNPRWFDKHPEHAAYIAGEGWIEQYQQPEECFEYDEDEGYEEADQECLDEAYRQAELNAFLAKSDEREWISKREHQPVKFRPEHVEGVLLKKGSVEAMERELWKLGLNHVEVLSI